MEWTWIEGNSTPNQPGVYGQRGLGSPTKIPGGRSAIAFWQYNEQEFWLYGGYGYDINHNVGGLSDLWLYNTSSRTWTFVNDSETVNVPPVYGPMGQYNANYNPGARDNMAFWSGNNGILWLFGGENSAGQRFADLWSYNTTTGYWALMNGSQLLNQAGNYSSAGVANVSNAPGARLGAFTWTDLDGNLWFFGGLGYGNSTAEFGDLNDLWVYNTSQSV